MLLLLQDVKLFGFELLESFFFLLMEAATSMHDTTLLLSWGVLIMIKKATIDRIEGTSVRSARPYQVKDHMNSQQLHLLQHKEDLVLSAQDLE